MKIRLLRAELFHADRRTDRRADQHDEAQNCFRNFAKGAQKLRHPSKYCVISFDITTDIAFKSTLLRCGESQHFWTS
jgi:hypothetical protein